MRHKSGLGLVRDPPANNSDLLVLGLEREDCRWRAVEYGYRIGPVLVIAVNVGHYWAEQAVCLRANLMGSAVVDAQGARASPDVYA